ncbi:hypothetical protein AB0H76_12725 [Nocardia sp. NPDC050712]|uniref:hypothetical protein n=1 Tax=Nocardia sp. NPDC050712 TaxID=3155518 RepID=UPI0033C8DEA9
MKRLVRTATAVAGMAVAVVSMTGAAAAAPEGSAYFNYGGKNCAITPDGVIGCDGWQQVQVFSVPIGGGIPISVPAPQSIQDAGGMRPSYDFGQPFTQPGGNPDFFAVANDSGPFGPRLSHAGAFCEISFRGWFRCVPRGA